MKKLFLQLIIALFLFIYSHFSFAGDWHKIVISSDGFAYLNLAIKNRNKDDAYFHSIKYNLNNKLQIKYEIEGMGIKDKCGSRPDSLDSLSSKIALLAGCDSSSKRAQGKYYSGIMIVDAKSNKEIAFFNYTRLYSFSPNGDAIVFFEGPVGPYQGGPLPPKDEMGLWLYDFNRKTRKKIDTLGLGVMDLNWSEHDGNIYVYGNKIYRYNVKSGKTEIVPYKGIYFSPDGKYYIFAPSEGGASIYRTEDNQLMYEWERMILGKSTSKYAELRFRFWSRQLNALIVSHGQDWQNVIFDVNKGKIIGEFKGFVIGTNSNGSLAAINPMTTDGKWFDQSQVEILNLQEVVSKYQGGKH